MLRLYFFFVFFCHCLTEVRFVRAYFVGFGWLPVANFLVAAVLASFCTRDSPFRTCLRAGNKGNEETARCVGFRPCCFAGFPQVWVMVFLYKSEKTWGLKELADRRSRAFQHVNNRGFKHFFKTHMWLKEPTYIKKTTQKRIFSAFCITERSGIPT